MIEILLKTLDSGFKLWNHRQKMNIYNKFLKIKKGIRDERNKPPLERDMVKYTEYVNQLRDISEAFNTFVSESNSANTSE